MTGESRSGRANLLKDRSLTTKQVLVEGMEEVLVFNNLVAELQLNEIQARDYGGKDSLRRFLTAFIRHPDFSKVRSLAVVADADFNVGGTRDRIRGALQNAGLPHPTDPLTEASAGNLRVSYLILPHSRDQGMLEDVCLDSVRSEPVMECVDQFIECVKGKREDWPKRETESKARVHAYLASLDRPDLRLGEAAAKGLWNFDSAAFDPLKELLRNL
jgi:hypothetical protein